MMNSESTNPRSYRGSNSGISSQERQGSHDVSGRTHHNFTRKKRHHHWDKDATFSKSERSRERSSSPSDERKRRRRSRSRSPLPRRSRSREDKNRSKHFHEKGPAARAREQTRFEKRQEFAKQHDEQERKANIAVPNYKPTRLIAPVTTATKLVEEIEKRKSLFSKKDKETAPGPSVWKSTTLTDDSDGKMTAKFKRLMGIKGAEAASSEKPPLSSSKGKEEYLANLEKQYEVARTITHTQRGVGLGFGSQKPTTNNSSTSSSSRQ